MVFSDQRHPRQFCISFGNVFDFLTELECFCILFFDVCCIVYNWRAKAPSFFNFTIFYNNIIYYWSTKPFYCFYFICCVDNKVQVLFYFGFFSRVFLYVWDCEIQLKRKLDTTQNIYFYVFTSYLYDCRCFIWVCFGLHLHGVDNNTSGLLTSQLRQNGGNTHIPSSSGFLWINIWTKKRFFLYVTSRLHSFLSKFYLFSSFFKNGL